MKGFWCARPQSNAWAHKWYKSTNRFLRRWTTPLTCLHHRQRSKWVKRSLKSVSSAHIVCFISSSMILYWNPVHVSSGAIATKHRRGVDHRGWGLDPLKICRRGRGHTMFWPSKIVTFYHSKLLLDNSASFTSSRTKDSCQKRKVKLIVRGAWRSLMAWPDWSWPPYFTKDLRYRAEGHRDQVMMKMGVQLLLILLLQISFFALVSPGYLSTYHSSL